MKNLTGANLLPGGFFSGFFDVFFKEVDPIYQGILPAEKDKGGWTLFGKKQEEPSEAGQGDEAFAGYVEKIGDKVVEMVVYRNRICRAVILTQDKPKGSPESGFKGLSDFTVHLADRLGVPFNLGEAIAFTHEELGSARRHHVAPPFQRPGACVPVGPPGSLGAPLQAPQPVAFEAPQQVTEVLPDPPVAAQSGQALAPAPVIAPAPAIAPEPEPQAHASSSPTEATGQVVQAGMARVIGRDARSIEIFSITLQTKNGQVNFNGVDLQKKFNEGAFRIGDWVCVKKTVMDFIVERSGVKQERTKNVYVVTLVKSR